MLTKNDAKIIKKIVEDAIAPVQQDVSGLKTDVSGLKQDFSGLKKNVSGLKQDVSGLKTDVSGLKQDVSGLRTGQDNLQAGQEILRVEMKVGFKKLERKIQKEHKLGGEILDFLEKEDREIKQKVDRIEFHLGIAPN